MNILGGRESYNIPALKNANDYDPKTKYVLTQH
jgi:hypothetical protein